MSPVGTRAPALLFGSSLLRNSSRASCETEVPLGDTQPPPGPPAPRPRAGGALPFGTGDNDGQATALVLRISTALGLRGLC